MIDFLNGNEALGLGSIVSGVVIWAIRHWVHSKRIEQAAEVLEGIAETGVKVAWSTYTAEEKFEDKTGGPTGVLDGTQAQAARKKALDAALGSVSAAGLALIQKVYKEGLDQALQHTIEAKYAELKPALQGVA